MPFHSLIWKLAEEALCYADWDGFCSQALPGETPGAFLRTAASWVSVLGLKDVCPGLSWGDLVFWGLLAGICALWRFAAFPRLRGTFWEILALAPLLATVAPLLNVDTHLWTLPDRAFPYTNLLGLGVILGILAVGRRWTAQRPGRVLLAVALCGALYVPLGLSAPLAGIVLLFDSTRKWRFLWWHPLAYGLLASEMGMVHGWVYDDLAWGYALGMSQSFLNGAWLDPFGFWPTLVLPLLIGGAVLSSVAISNPRSRGTRDPTKPGHFGRDARPLRAFFASAFSRTLHACNWKIRLPCQCVVCLIVSALIALNRPISLAPQLDMQRALRAGDFEGVLRVEDKREIPPRMETAYRILALCRTRRVAEDLFRWPMSVRPASTVADEFKMDGFDLLYNYGFLLPARLAILESAAASGDRPVHFRLLGDIAFLRGETRLAERAWRQLARCPFRQDEAHARLEALASGQGLRHPALAPLNPIAQYAMTWEDTVSRQPEPPFFKGAERNVEQFIYGRMLTVKSAPPPMVCESVFAAYLLMCDTEAIVRSRAMMDALCPTGVYPKTWQQALLAYVSSLPETSRDAFVSTLRNGVFSETEVASFDSFVTRLKDAADVRQLLETFGNSYWFYEVASR